MYLPAELNADAAGAGIEYAEHIAGFEHGLVHPKVRLSVPSHYPAVPEDELCDEHVIRFLFKTADDNGDLLGYLREGLHAVAVLGYRADLFSGITCNAPLWETDNIAAGGDSFPYGFRDDRKIPFDISGNVTVAIHRQYDISCHHRLIGFL